MPQDIAEAERWWREAAEQGDAEAQSNLGNLYDMGEGVPQDFAEAMKWYRKAAEQGDVHALNNLGLMYYESRGIPQDGIEAYKWIFLAVAQGLKVAEPNLDRCTEHVVLERVEGQATRP